MPADPRRVKDLFVALVELPDEQARQAFLDRECGADDELRRRVMALLFAHEHMDLAVEKASRPRIVRAKHHQTWRRFIPLVGPLDRWRPLPKLLVQSLLANTSCYR